jgi:fructokinase
MLQSADLTLQMHGKGKISAGPPAVIIGEVLWDLFADGAFLGGAPLNFAVHASRLCLTPILLSALGDDELGDRAIREIQALGIETTLIKRSKRWKTGTASVVVGPDGQPAFHIARPAAYDDLSLSDEDLNQLAGRRPAWLYFGTLFTSTKEGRATLERVIDAIPDAARFYDVNLRRGFDSLPLVSELLAVANVVKMNESEFEAVAEFFEWPRDVEAFCRCALARFGWRAVCITLGERGCAIFDGTSFVQAKGESVQVVDTVGAGDAFAAAFVHGLIQNWPAEEIARFANRVGGLVASRAGAIPDWNILETVSA